MSPNCVHQPSSIVPAAGTRSDCWGGTSGGRWAGGSYRDLPKPQLSGSSDFSSLGSPILIQGNHLKRERRQPKPLLSAALTLAGPGEAWPRREAPGCGWNGHLHGRKTSPGQAELPGQVEGGARRAGPCMAGKGRDTRSPGEAQVRSEAPETFQPPPFSSLGWELPCQAQVALWGRGAGDGRRKGATLPPSMNVPRLSFPLSSPSL